MTFLGYRRYESPVAGGPGSSRCPGSGLGILRESVAGPEADDLIRR